MSERIAVLGLGTMGAGMAANLLKAGFTVTVYNRTAVRAEALAGAGARVAATPHEAARGAAIVIAMVADDVASRAVWTGKDGALTAADNGALLIDSSTLSPAWIKELANLAARRGLELLDAPVTGSRAQAAAGKLLFLVGGSEHAIKIATPAFNAMGREAIHLGPTGSGATMKLINNFLCGVQAASLAEGLAWIERSGLDLQQALSILTAGAPGSPLLGTLAERMATHDYSVNFLLCLMSKDLKYAQEEAARCAVDLKTAKAAGDLFASAIAKGYGEQDMASVIEPLRAK
ncbi:MAG TPA: NAD(P)-dependent oxidoreductase [Terracidiphilus sp.]|nr:NAD(P)-dependent oxidoreductase [Terracidiphilus sp.]